MPAFRCVQANLDYIACDDFNNDAPAARPPALTSMSPLRRIAGVMRRAQRSAAPLKPILVSSGIQDKFHSLGLLPYSTDFNNSCGKFDVMATRSRL